MRLHHVRVLGPTGLSTAQTVEVNAEGAEDRDATGLVLSPGWMDLHAHLRDPGFPQKETLLSGATSAAVGGFTHVLAMANTDPVTDRTERLQSLLTRSQALPIRISFVGAVTIGLEGRQLTDAVALKAAGAVALSDDGRHAMDGVMLGRALGAAAAAGLPLLVHAQAEQLGDGPDAEALVDGVIDAIATDHAPHELAAKQAGANGFHCFETAVGVVLGLGLDGAAVYRACVSRPREIVGQSLEDEWILIDPDAEWRVDAASFKSRGKNTPFQGRRLRGRVIMTVCRGQVVTERVMQHV